MPRSLLRDPALLLYLGFLGALAVLVALPLVPSDPEGLGESLWTKEFLLSQADVPLSLLVVGTLLATLRRARSGRERRFWGLLALAFLFALPVHVLGFRTWDGASFRLDLVQDLLFAGFYLALSLALELRIIGTRADAYRGVRSVRIAATVLFILGLFTYFVLIPGYLSRETYDSWVPSFFLYVVLDLHLVVRLAGLHHLSEPGPWRRTYLSLLVAFFAWAVCDTAELLHYAGFVPELPSGGWLELPWFLPYLPVLWAAHLRRHLDREEAEPSEPAEHPPDSRLARLPVLVTQPLFYAAVLPLLHFGAHTAGITEPTIREPRELTVLLMLPLLAALSFLHHRALERENERLEVERLEVADRVQKGQRMEAVGRLAGGIAHDFNNLLQVIRSSNELLLSRLEPGHRARPHAEEIRAATDHAVLLTDQLLAVGRRKPMDPRPVDVNEVVLHVTTMVDRVIGDDVRVEVVARQGVGRVCVDRSRLEAGLLNLAINARDAMPTGGTLSIETRRLAEDGPDGPVEWASIQVRDTGIGMDELTSARIFEPFFTTKEEGKGTGLGLSMLYGFVEQCEGRVEVQSAPGSGTTIRILLPPQAGAPEEEVAPEPVVPAAPPQPLVAPGRKTVLVVEDESGVRGVLRELLVDHGYHVLEARDGDQAVALLHSGARPDLVLTDVVMPGMRGTELVERIKSALPEAKILYMTGDPGSEYGSPHLEGVPLLEKPFTRDSLTRSVDALLVHGR